MNRLFTNVPRLCVVAFVSLVGLSFVACDVEDDGDDNGGGGTTDTRPEVAKAIRLADGNQSIDLDGACTTHKTNDGKIAPGSDIDAVALVNGLDNSNVTFATAADLKTDAFICGVNDFTNANAATGADDGSWVSLNGSDLTVEFGRSVREGDKIEIYELDVQGGMVTETIFGVQLCDSINGPCQASQFTNLETKNGAPIILDF
ncbi:MAG: hypothetical protein HUU55_19195 [Myxococcales bacterium]|nr:hypothetical protein [Myxococcales bacterium]